MNRLHYVFVMTVLAGCGSTGVLTPTPTPTPTPDSSRFAPNYLSALSAGRQWNTPTITVHLSSPPGRDLTPAFLAARASWEAQYGTLFTLTLTDATDADILVSTVPVGSLGDTTIGLTTITYRSSDNRILHAEMQLDISLGDSLFTQVFAHELGHALGIDGHSPSNADVMFSRAHLPMTITERDRNTLLAINADRVPGDGRKKDDGNREVTVVCRFKKP